MWMEVDFHDYRQTHQWRMEETDECLFLIDVALPNPSNPDMWRLFEIAGQLHQRIRAALEINQGTRKGKERQRKVSVWLYAPKLLARASYVTSAKPRRCYGIADAAGLHLVKHEIAWDDPAVIEIVLHEAVHLWWADQVGKAPSLLNEGIAMYFQSMLGANAVREREDLRNSWQQYAARAEPGFLRRLCKDEVFWKQDAAREPVFMVGGQLIAFLLETYGMPSVRQIFLKSHFNDPKLVDHIEDVTGESIDQLEQRINEATESK